MLCRSNEDNLRWHHVKPLNWVIISSEKNWRLQLDVSISMLWSSSGECRTLGRCWRIFYIQSPQPNPDWGISYIPSLYLLPLCLSTTDSVQWAHTPPQSQSTIPPVPACTLQRTNPPASSFAWSSSSLLKQQHLPESGILRRTIRAYWSKRRVVTSSSFQN